MWLMAMTEQDSVGALGHAGRGESSAASNVPVEEPQPAAAHRDLLRQRQLHSKLGRIVVSVNAGDRRPACQEVKKAGIGKVSQVDDQVGRRECRQDGLRKNVSAAGHMGVCEHEDAAGHPPWNSVKTLIALKTP